MNKIEKLVKAFKELDAGGEDALTEAGSTGAMFIADRGEAFSIGVSVENEAAAIRLLGILLENVRDRVEPDMDLAEFGRRIGETQIEAKELSQNLQQLENNGIEVDVEELFKQLEDEG